MIYLLLIVMLAWAALAFRFYRLFQVKVREQLLLAGVAELVGTTLDINEIYNSIVKAVIEAIRVDRALLLLYDEQKRELVLVTEVGADAKDIQDMRLKIDDSVFGRIFKEGRPRLMHTTRNTKYVQSLGAGEYAAVPMKVRKKIIGLLVIDNALSKRSLKNLNMKLLTALAGQLAAAIDNAGLYKDAQEKIKELQRLNRVSSLGAMVAGIAHEIKNPLTALDLCVQLIDAGQTGQQFWEEFGAIISTEIKRLKAITEKFLNFARAPEIKMQTVNLADIGRSVFALVRTQAEQANVEIALNIAEDLQIKTDTQKFTQVLLNLVLNAIQAMPQGRALKGYVELGAAPEEDKINITVRDNGCGISEENQKKLFQLFFTTKKQTGTGLGLYIVREIVEMHGGRISVNSLPNFGTTFTIQLPAVKTEKTEQTAQTAASAITAH